MSGDLLAGLMPTAVFETLAFGQRVQALARGQFAECPSADSESLVHASLPT